MPICKHLLYTFILLLFSLLLLRHNLYTLKCTDLRYTVLLVLTNIYIPVLPTSISKEHFHAPKFPQASSQTILFLSRLGLLWIKMLWIFLYIMVDVNTHFVGCRYFENVFLCCWSNLYFPHWVRNSQLLHIFSNSSVHLLNFIHSGEYVIMRTHRGFNLHFSGD